MAQTYRLRKLRVEPVVGETQARLGASDGACPVSAPAFRFLRSLPPGGCIRMGESDVLPAHDRGPMRLERKKVRRN